MKAKFALLHFSYNWIQDPHIKYFSSFEDAQAYNSAFESKRISHAEDSYLIVEIKEQGRAVNVNAGSLDLECLYKFTKDEV